MARFRTLTRLLLRFGNLSLYHVPAAFTFASEISSTVVVDVDGSAPSEPPTEPATVEVCGYHAVGQCYLDSPGRSSGASMGTTVSLVVRYPAGKLLAFDEDASTIDCFEDSDGKNLLDSAPGAVRKWNFGVPSNQRVARDGRSAVLDIRVWNLPTPGSRAVRLEGQLVFKQGAKRITVRGSELRLANGSEATVGPMAVRIDEIKTLPFTGDPHLKSSEPPGRSVTIKTEHHDPDGIESFRLLDASGKVVAETSIHGRVIKNERTWGVFGLQLSPEIQRVIPEITYWSHVTQLEVPLSLTITAGL